MSEFSRPDDGLSKEQMRMQEAGFEPIIEGFFGKETILVEAGTEEDKLYKKQEGFDVENIQGFVTIKTQPTRWSPAGEDVYIAVKELEEDKVVTTYRSLVGGSKHFVQSDDEISAIDVNLSLVEQLYELGYTDLDEADEKLYVTDDAKSSIFVFNPEGTIDALYKDLDITHGPAQAGLGAKVTDMQEAANKYGTVEQRIRMTNGWADFTISASYPSSADDLVFHREPTYTEVDFGPFLPGPAEVDQAVVDSSVPIEVIDGISEINGYKVEDIEAYMRPNKASQSGFLIDGDSLLETIKQDTETVRNLGLQHIDLATPLLYVAHMKRLGFYQDTSLEGSNFVDIGGHPYAVESVSYRGYQDSPFGDGDKSSTDFTVTNMETGQGVGFSGLVGGMIQKYGFYEGAGVHHRVDPIDIVRTFDMFSGIGGEVQIPEDDPVRQITTGKVSEAMLTTPDQLKRYEKLRHLEEGAVVAADVIYQPQNFADANLFFQSSGYGERGSLIDETFLEKVEPTTIEIPPPYGENSYSFNTGIPFTMLHETPVKLYETLYENIASVDTTALNSEQLVHLFDQLLNEDTLLSENRAYIQASVPSEIRRSLIEKLVIDDYKLPIALYKYGFDERHSSSRTLNREKLVGVIELFKDHLPDLDGELDNYGIDRDDRPVAEQIADLYTSLQPGVVHEDRSIKFAQLEEVLPEITGVSIKQIQYFTRIIHAGGELNDKQKSILSKIGLDPEEYTRVAQNSRNGTGWLIRETLHGENYHELMKDN